MKKNAIIMAGGKGTRMKSELSKVLHPIMEVPMVDYVMRACKEAGAERIVTVVGYAHEQVEQALQGSCEFALQEPQLGTGHAVMQAKQLENETGITLVTSGDCPCITGATYKKLYDELGDADMAILTAIPDDNAAYGRVIRREDGTVNKIVEFKDCTEEEKKAREINTSIYAFKNESLFAGLKKLTNNNAQHEYYLPDLAGILQDMGKKVIAVVCDDWREVEGVNDNAELARASEYIRKRINTHWMKAGVTMTSPDNTFIGPDVTFGHDDILYPNVFLSGKTSIGNHVTILPGCVIREGSIKDGETVSPSCCEQD
jgi:bifunctional UDP-N-acetylglucosamine pyrophosphorylase/glucosamine-1-phosphate N-acetyltransferase